MIIREVQFDSHLRTYFPGKEFAAPKDPLGTTRSGTTRLRLMQFPDDCHTNLSPVEEMHVVKKETKRYKKIVHESAEGQSKGAQEERKKGKAFQRIAPLTTGLLKLATCSFWISPRVQGPCSAES